MGKTRKEKRYRLHKKAPTASSADKEKEEDVEMGNSEPAVPPLPQEIMRSESIVSLKPKSEEAGGKKDEPTGIARKKDKRKLRREKWLQSK